MMESISFEIACPYECIEAKVQVRPEYASRFGFGMEFEPKCPVCGENLEDKG